MTKTLFGLCALFLSMNAFAGDVSLRMIGEFEFIEQASKHIDYDKVAVIDFESLKVTIKSLTECYATEVSSQALGDHFQDRTRNNEFSGDSLSCELKGGVIKIYKYETTVLTGPILMRGNDLIVLMSDKRTAGGSETKTLSRIR